MEPEKWQYIKHGCPYGEQGAGVRCPHIGKIETPRGDAQMYVCGQCTQIFFFADFDFDPETGGEA